MRTTLALDDDLIAEAQAYTGLIEKSSLVREALKALIQREAARRMAQLGGSQPHLRAYSASSLQVRLILIDTSIWIAHLRTGDSTLSRLLESGEVLSHPFVIGELAMGNLRPRNIILDTLRNLPQAIAARHDEVIAFIEEQRLFGRGIGYVDAHLLAAVRLSPGTVLWTRDARLHDVAENLGLSYRS